VLDSGFYPNWRDYYVESDVLTQYARGFIAAGGNQNANQWDVGSDPHGMATAATITGYKFVDDTNEGGWGVGLCHRQAGDLLGAGSGAGRQGHPRQSVRADRLLRQRHQRRRRLRHQPQEGQPLPPDRDQ
jgi:hypothetical protein